MKKTRILHKILKRTYAYRVLSGFLIFVLILAMVFTLIEPEIYNYGEGLWYCYVNMFTIGFGDIVPVTVLGRILSVFLTIYATVVIAILTAGAVAFYNEITTKEVDKTKEVFLDKLTRLPELSKDELIEISESVKAYEATKKKDAH